MDKSREKQSPPREAIAKLVDNIGKLVFNPAGSNVEPACVSVPAPPASAPPFPKAPRQTRHPSPKQSRAQAKSQSVDMSGRKLASSSTSGRGMD